MDKDAELPRVVATRRRRGRDGNPPLWELPSGHRDPFRFLRFLKEWPKLAARREVKEEAGAKLGWLVVCALNIIRNPVGSKYPLVSYIVYYVGFVRGALFWPRERGHRRYAMTLQAIGIRTRAGRFSLADAKTIRAAVITAGYPADAVCAAMGELD